MTSLENYFGIRFLVYKQLDPFSISKLEQKANAIANLVGFDISDFFVYIHVISLFNRNVHFSKGIQLKDKLKRLEVEFSASPTQIKKGQVKFYNAYIDHNLEKGINELFSETSLLKIYDGEVLDNHNWLETTLITYIKKDLNLKYRKIKVNVQAIPTNEYEKKLKKNKSAYLTQVDLSLENKIKLNLRNLNPKEIEIIRQSLLKNKIIINMETKQDDEKLPTNYNSSPNIYAENVVANFASGQNINQIQENINTSKKEQIYKDLKTLGVEDVEINSLKEIIAKKDNIPVQKKIFNWIGKVMQKAIEKGVEIKTPELMDLVQGLM